MQRDFFSKDECKHSMKNNIHKPSTYAKKYYAIPMANIPFIFLQLSYFVHIFKYNFFKRKMFFTFAIPPPTKRVGGPNFQPTANF